MARDPNAPGFNGHRNLCERLWEVEDEAATAPNQEGDGIDIVGREIRLNIADLPNAPEN